jgi:hypothetical protein
MTKINLLTYILIGATFIFAINNNNFILNDLWKRQPEYKNYQPRDNLSDNNINNSILPIRFKENRENNVKWNM